MEIKIAWLYPEFTNMYGDGHNLDIFKKQCNDININVLIERINIGSKVLLDTYDFIFFGSSSLREINLYYTDFISRKEDIRRSIENNVIFLCIGSAFRLLGENISFLDGKSMDGLNVFKFQSKELKEKKVGFLKVDFLNSFVLLGFINNNFDMLNINSPIGFVDSKLGNKSINSVSSSEGFIHNNLIATNLHGPLLSRNIELSYHIIEKIASIKKQYINLDINYNSYEYLSKKSLLNQMG